MREIKKCKTCRRTIIDKNNLTGLCPKCKKAANTVVGGVGVLGFGVAIKRFGPELFKTVIEAAKK